MRRLAAVVCAGATAIGFSLPIASPVQGEPFTPCPYDPAVLGAQMQYFNQKTAELVALQNDVNTRILGPMDGAQRDAWAASPAGQAVVAQGQQIIAERDNPSPACFPLPTVSTMDAPNLGPLEPIPDRPMIVDSLPGPNDESNVDCTQLRAAYEALGPVTDAADAAAKLSGEKIPGLNLVTGGSLAFCGLDAIPAAIANPSQRNQLRVFDGACGAVNQISMGLLDTCGDTTVGSH